VGRTVWAPGADGPRAVEIYLISKVFGNVFRENRFRADSLRIYGGQSVINLETRQNGVQLGWTRQTVRGLPVDVRGAQADSPRSPGGQSAWPNGHLRQPLTSHFYRWNSNTDTP
jgi:hypothetical protein